MNTFEAGVISAIPVGGIVGGILCKSYGLFAVIGGVIAGIVAGGVAGWVYSLFILVMTATFSGIWQGIRKLPDFDFEDSGNKKLISSMNRNSEHGTIWGVISGCAVGFLFRWWQGLLVAIVMAIVTAFIVVTVGPYGLRKDPVREKWRQK